MVESWARGRSSLKEGSQMCHECEIREQRIVLSPRTGLNGGERGQEQVREAKKQKEEIENPSQDQPKWWRSGSVNLFGPYLCLCPCLYGHLCPCPYSCLSFPLWGAVSLPFCWATVKKGGSGARVGWRI